MDAILAQTSSHPSLSSARALQKQSMCFVCVFSFLPPKNLRWNRLDDAVATSSHFQSMPSMRLSSAQEAGPLINRGNLCLWY